MYRPEIPFKFELPFEVFHKAGKPGQERRIGGMISTDRNDRQGEIVLQRGLDFSEFLSNGWFNDNHSKDTTGIVGYPLKVEKRKHNGRDGHYVEGYLLEGYEPADKIWTLANALQKTGRRLGFSIEGAVTRREGPSGKVIAEAKVRNVAITNAPVNTDTGLEVLAKSMLALEREADIKQALVAGSAISSPSPSHGEGFPLRVESLEVDPKKKRKKRLTNLEAMEIVKAAYPGISNHDASRIVAFAAAQGRPRRQ
jgi:hypothetical protein